MTISKTCLRCGESCVPRISTRAGDWPRCHSTVWDKPRKSQSREKTVSTADHVEESPQESVLERVRKRLGTKSVNWG